MPKNNEKLHEDLEKNLIKEVYAVNGDLTFTMKGLTQVLFHIYHVPIEIIAQVLQKASLSGRSRAALRAIRNITSDPAILKIVADGLANDIDGANRIRAHLGVELHKPLE